MSALQAVWRFGVHTVVGIVLFALVALGAVFLQLLTEVLLLVANRWQFIIADFIILGLRFAELLLYALDLLCFTVYMSKETIVFLRRIIYGVRLEVGDEKSR